MPQIATVAAVDKKARLYYLNNLLSALVTDADEAAEAKRTGKARGPVTGLRDVDEGLGGYLPPGLHIVLGPPGAGKTALALQIAADCQAEALFVSFEMSSLELFRRLIARNTKTFLGKLKNGTIDGDAVNKLAVTTINALGHVAIVDGTRGHCETEFLVKCAEQQREKTGKHLLLVIDSLQACARNMYKGVPEYEACNSTLADLANLAAELQAPIVVISHKNRAANLSKNGAGMHGGKSSGNIEYDSESILDISIDSEAKDDSSGEREATVQIKKNRNGAPGYEIPLKFCGRLQEFRQV